MGTFSKTCFQKHIGSGIIFTIISLRFLANFMCPNLMLLLEGLKYNGSSMTIGISCGRQCKWFIMSAPSWHQSYCSGSTRDYLCKFVTHRPLSRWILSVTPHPVRLGTMDIPISEIYVYPNFRIGSSYVMVNIINIVNLPLYSVFSSSEKSIKVFIVIFSAVIFTL